MPSSTVAARTGAYARANGLDIYYQEEDSGQDYSYSHKTKYSMLRAIYPAFYPENRVQFALRFLFNSGEQKMRRKR